MYIKSTLNPGQTIATLPAQHLQAPAKRSQHLNATDCNIVFPPKRNVVGCNMLHTFANPVATCCHVLRIENQTIAHAQAQNCFTNLANDYNIQHPQMLNETFNHFQI